MAPRADTEGAETPLPSRYGGEETVPTCYECHDFKDRTRFPGVDHGWEPDEPVSAAIAAGYETVRSRATVGTAGESVPLVVYVLLGRIEAICTGTEQADAYGLADEVLAMASIVHRATVECSTPEARGALARLFCLWLDALDRNLEGVA